MSEFLFDGPEHALATLLLGHGAGAPMDSAFMTAIAALLAEHGLRVARFEFPYMAARRHGSRRPPPPRAEKMTDFVAQTAAALKTDRPLLIGGKSYGGRVASLAAQSLFDTGIICGLVLLGYPFHPPGRPENLRTGHLGGMTVPTLICQGERDPFGSKAEVETYRLPAAFTVNWARDGNHDLRPRKKSGLTPDQNLRDAALAISAFARAVTGPANS